MAKTKKLTSKQQILAFKEKNGTPWTKIAEVWGCTPGHAQRVLTGTGDNERPLSPDNLAKFNAHFDTNIK